MIVVVLGGFHCLWWFSVVFTICGGFGVVFHVCGGFRWFRVFVVILGGF